jgi:hypothetical protein
VSRILKELGLPAHRQSKKFCLGGKNGNENSFKWANLMKIRLK